MFNDLELSEGMTISMFRYYRDGQKKYTKVATKDGKSFYCSRSAESQLYHLLGLSVRGLEEMSWEERNAVIAGKLAERLSSKKPIILRVINNHIWAVVTEVHVLLRHSEVWNVVEEALTEKFGTYQKKKPMRTNEGLYTKYLLPKLWKSDKLFAGLIVYNSVKGLGSLRIGAYYEIIACSNGLISSEYKEIYSRTHRGNKDEILDSLRSGLDLFLNTFKPIDMSNIDEHININEVVEGLDIAKKYKDAVLKSIFLDGSRFELASSLSSVAKSAPPNTSIQLEELSFKIINKEVFRK